MRGGKCKKPIVPGVALPMLTWTALRNVEGTIFEVREQSLPETSVIVLNTQSQEINGHVVLMRISTSRRREEKREADATWRCRVSRCLRACACRLRDVMLATHECTYYDIPLCERNEN